MSIHIAARHWWAFNAHEGPITIPYTSRCGLLDLSKKGIAFVIRTGREGFSAVPTCDACILLHWLNPAGTEHEEDYIYIKYDV